MAHDENFWMNACMHAIFCKRELADCQTCQQIQHEIDKEESNRRNLMSSKDNRFYQGMGVILGWLARDRREDTLVEYALNDNGISISDLVRAKVDDYDLIPIKKCLSQKILEQASLK